MEIKLANLLLRFLLKVCVLAALSYWGFKNGENRISKIGLGVGIPLLTSLVWGMFGSSGAPLLLREPCTFY